MNLGRLVMAVTAAVCIARTAGAQTLAPAPEPFRIMDNSFLVEEAFNQERGVFQNIFNLVREDEGWAASFTQEWPVTSQRHQFSYTLVWAGGDDVAGFGDTLLNYRYQFWMEGPGRPAFSPRLSLVLPTAGEGLGANSFGLQLNLPFSKQTGDVYWHWNAGLTWLPAAEQDDHEYGLEMPFLAASAIYRAHPMLHPMLETVISFEELPRGPGTVRETLFTLSPGVRGGWDLGDHQLILGLAVPITWAGEKTDAAAFIYASYELPFGKFN
jgi:hypothetical protein